MWTSHTDDEYSGFVRRALQSRWVVPDFGLLEDEEDGEPGQSEKRAALSDNLTRADDLITIRTKSTVIALCMHYMHRPLSETRHDHAACITRGPWCISR